MVYVHFSNLFAVRVIQFWQWFREVNFVGGGLRREIVLRNVFLPE